jgi:hypothetical protein
VNFLQVQAAIDHVRKLPMAPTDLIKYFYGDTTATTKMINRPKPLWEKATIQEIGAVVRVTIPVQVRDTTNGHRDREMYLMILVGSDHALGNVSAFWATE